MVDLKGNPFFLDDGGIGWVNDTKAGMTLEEKIGQLFCVLGLMDDENFLRPLTEKHHVGGVEFRPGPGAMVRKAHEFLQSTSKIPLLLASNLESGGEGIAVDATNFAKPMAVAATGDANMGYALGKISCSEGAAVGGNWAYAPVVDIDLNFRNPITNLRTFGNNPDTVIEMAGGYLRAADEEGVAVSIKHFPGDGIDERDQHLLTTVNTLSCAEWDASYGKVYKALIDQGAKTAMIGHIALPSYQKHFDPDYSGKPMPATLSKALVTDLLRNQLGFNGLTVTDASGMRGMMSFTTRREAVPRAIAAGCDMLLFVKNTEEDFAFMLDGYKSGVITEARLDDAVTRILATKASLRLHEKQANGTLVPTEAEMYKRLRVAQSTAWGQECADKAITLVKDNENLLPLSPAKTKKVLLNVLEESDAMDTPLRTTMKARLEKEGFEVTVRNRDVSIDMAAVMGGGALDEKFFRVLDEYTSPIEKFRATFDLVLYIANCETASNNPVIRLFWKGFMGSGNDGPWFVEEVPTVFVSLANPYHLLDVPMIQTFINAYTNNEFVLDALIEKLMGRSAFKGISPVDAFCGREDTRL